MLNPWTAWREASRIRATAHAGEATGERELARALVMRHGWNTVACQIVNPGMRYWFTPDQMAVVGFVEAGRAWVAAGEPVGPPDRVVAAAEAFAAVAGSRGRRVIYFGAQAPLAERLPVRPPLARLGIGAQPVWNPGDWPVLVSRVASLRAQIGRARNKGVTVAPLPAEAAARHPEIHRCLVEWLTTRGLPPMRFLVTPDVLAIPAGRRVFVARRNGVVVAYLVMTPVPARQGWLVEQIVRGHNAPNGVSELLIDAAMRTLATEGVPWMTLGLVPLARMSGGANAPEPSAAVRLLLERLRVWGERLYNFAGLEAFRARLHPQAWEPVYLLSHERRTSLATLYAVAGAFGGAPPPFFVGRALLRRLRKKEV
ncbi:MAG: phosphatidylglycerol lysyltransferase domain-containing protein [Chloroflexaceae bacterium]